MKPILSVKLRRTKKCPCPASGKIGQAMWEKLRGATLLVSGPRSWRTLSDRCGAKRYYWMDDDDIVAIRLRAAKRHGRNESMQHGYWVCEHVVLKELRKD